MRRARNASRLPGVNMTPMIDVVFQMIIFFICTSELDKFSTEEDVRLERAPHGPAVEERNPLTVTVNVCGDGEIRIAGFRLTPAEFRGVIATTVARHGVDVPVVVHGDRTARHEHIRAVMDACRQAGIRRFSFAAVKEEA